MLWLCAHYPDLPAEALAPPADRVVAVIERFGNRKCLSWISQPAVERGLQVGMTLPAALALVPDLAALQRNPLSERQAIQARACWAYQFGSPVTLDIKRFAVWVEVGASISLNGGWPNLAKRIAESASESYRAQFGVAPTLSASLLLARALPNIDTPVLKSGAIRRAINDLPLAALPIEDSAIWLLQGAGLQTIADVLAVPAESLALRIGPAPVRSIRGLLGKTPEAFESFEPPSSYRRRFHFQEPVESSEALLFPLKMMIADLCSYLTVRDAAVQVFVLRLVDHRKRVTLHPVGLSTPTRDPNRMMLTLRAQFERIAIEDGIVDISLEADRLEAFEALQDDLFGTSVTAGQRYAELCERLTARLGRDAVRKIVVSPDQRPEASQGDANSPAVDGKHHPPRPLWLLPKPRRIDPPTLLGPPERIELGWWEGAGAPRDYFVASDASGRLCWVYRDLEQGGYFLHGLWQ